MWNIVGLALKWVSPTLAGWFLSDVYNEAQTTQQQNPAGSPVTVFGNAAKKTIFEKWWFYLIVLGIVTVIFFILKQLKFIKR